MSGCRQYVLQVDHAERSRAESFAAASLREARARLASVPFDLVGSAHVFYLGGAAPDVRKARASAGMHQDELQGRLMLPEARKGWAKSVEEIGAQLDRARAADPLTWHVEPNPDQAGLLAVGVDTLYCSFWTSIDPQNIELLEAMRVLAKEGGIRVFVAHARLIWEVLPFGKHPFCVILQGASSAIKIKRGASSKTNPQCQVEFRSMWLWRDGPDRCVSTIAAMLRRWTAPTQRGEYFRVTVSRLDLAVDISSNQLDLTGLELPSGCFLTRARSKAQFYMGRLQEMVGRKKSIRDASKAQKRAARAHADKAFDGARQVSQHWSGLKYTGLAMGRSELGVRIYRKDVELDRPGVHKPYMRALWRSRGWQGEPVWRVEFTILGSALRTMTARARGRVDVEFDEHLRESSADEGRILIGNDWGGVRLALGGIWQYMTRSWMTLRIPLESNKQRTRWPIDEGWASLWSASWGLALGSGMALVDVRRYSKESASKMEVHPDGLAPGVHGPVRITHVEAMNRRPAAWKSCQPMAPGGDILERILDPDGRNQLGEWGWGPSVADDVEDLDVECTSAESRLEQMIPQIVGCFVKVAADMHLAGFERPGVDAVMHRLFNELPDDFDDRVQAKAAATALDAYRLTQLRRAAA